MSQLKQPSGSAAAGIGPTVGKATMGSAFRSGQKPLNQPAFIRIGEATPRAIGALGQPRASTAAPVQAMAVPPAAAVAASAFSTGRVQADSASLAAPSTGASAVPAAGPGDAASVAVPVAGPEAAQDAHELRAASAVEVAAASAAITVAASQANPNLPSFPAAPADVFAHAEANLSEVTLPDAVITAAAAEDDQLLHWGSAAVPAVKPDRHPEAATHLTLCAQPALQEGPSAGPHAKADTTPKVGVRLNPAAARPTLLKTKRRRKSQKAAIAQELGGGNNSWQELLQLGSSTENAAVDKAGSVTPGQCFACCAAVRTPA